MLTSKSKVEELPFVGPVYVKRLQKLGVKTVENLLHHIPSRYMDFRETKKIRSLKVGETANIQGEIISSRNIYTKTGKKIQLVILSDGEREIQLIWFNQPYLIRNMRIGARLSVAGQVAWYVRKLALFSPEYEVLDEGQLPIHTRGLIPVYPETSGISSKWLRRRISDSYSDIEKKLNEFLPEKILKENGLLDYKKSISSIHFPKNEEEYEGGRKRLSFNELLFLHLKNLERKSDWDQNRVTHNIKMDKKAIAEFIKNLSFKLTKPQETAIEEILSDMTKDIPMNRLLEGDVGSGKTVVAATAAFLAYINGFQSIFLAPTQILAQQHYQTLVKLFEPFKARVSLVTSNKKEEGFGKADIYVGTHALIHRKINEESVALVVIDEQHRFGVEQRLHLIKKAGKRRTAPHVLTMTATPIPRTIALTMYGDLSLSVLDELPKHRKPITTWVLGPHKRAGAYGWIDKQIEKEKIQVFVVCPLIEESEEDTMKQVKAATVEFEALKKVFPKRKIGLLHGRQKLTEKNEILNKFKEGKIDILVSTPVIEVGIDVPNATIMVIEAAERFGLSQLHQLRGRVGRGKKKSYCLVFTESRSKKSRERLTALKSAMTGFKLAELDLQMRGPGEIFGLRQHGFPELKIASWQDVSLIKKTRQVAKNAIANPKEYSKLFLKFNEQEVVPN